MPDGIESRATEYAMGKAKSINVVGRIKEAFLDGYREGYGASKRAVWKEDGIDHIGQNGTVFKYYVCTNCYFRYSRPESFGGDNFCPYCGAKMDEVRDES